MNNLYQFFTRDPAEFARRYIKYLGDVLASIYPDSISRFIGTLLDARSRGANIFFIGNGGSAATASHFANDLSISTNSYDQPFRAISLTDNTAILTSLGNDLGYIHIFEYQLRVLARRGDVLIGISASGNSPNILKAFDYAKTTGMKTLALTAFDGGKLRKISDDGIHVDTGSKEYGPAEDAHMVLDHLIGAYLIRYVKEGD